MVRLGLRLSLRGGREALIRLVLTASAVAVGVGVLLAVLADYHAFQVTNGKPCWECSRGLTGPPSGASNAELWNYRTDFFAGRPIERLDVAALGSRAPVPPGIPRLPATGRFYASPALAALLDSVPPAELGDRFPGSRAGIIGDAALSGPDELVIIIGRPPARLAAAPATLRVDAIATEPRFNSLTSSYRYGFGIGAIGLLFPMLVLIGTATRLAAARREERFAALRLVGATPQQINLLASVDAMVGAVLGTLAGIGVFLLIRPAVAGITITDSRYFTDVVTPTPLGYLAVLVGVPAAAACAALWSLRRVRISPLGVSRQVTPPAPGAWRAIPLLLGMVLFLGPMVFDESGEPNVGLAELGLLLIMIGLIVSGSWLTMRVARLSARFARGPSALLAARRLADHPKAAFRPVSGLVLAIFVGTAIAGFVPAVLNSQQAVGNGTLRDVLRTSFNRPENRCSGGCSGTPVAVRANGLPPAAAAELLGRLRGYPGTSALPLYASPIPGSGIDDVVGCASLRQLTALGQCARGAEAVRADFGSVLSTDNVLNLNDVLPVVDRRSPVVAADLTTLPMLAVLVTVDDPATLEKVRTLLANYPAPSGSTGAAQTFGEIAGTRAALLAAVQRIALVMVGLTLLVAGCGLAVSVGGSLMERKRPFTLLRLSGTPTRTLYAVVLLESVLPLALTALVAAAVGYAVAVPIVGRLAIKGTSVGPPGGGYFLTIGVGLIASLLVILAALPLLARSTEPDNAHFE